jgi:anaerobic ribonucleoside-triphosphate reductase activating protein
VNALTTGIKRGLTIIGGEPLTDYNYPEVLELVKKLKVDIPDLNIWVYTGYYYDELIEQDKTDIFDYIDVLVDGRFEEELKDPDLKWRGSSNQRIWYF